MFFWHLVLNIRDILCVLFFSQVDIYSPMAVSKSNNVEKKSLPRVIPPYRCDDTDTACLRRIEKQDTRARPHIRLGHGSKDTAHVRLGHGSKDTAHVRLGHGSKDTAHVRLGNGSKDMAHVRIDTSFINSYKKFDICTMDTTDTSSSSGNLLVLPDYILSYQGLHSR